MTDQEFNPNAMAEDLIAQSPDITARPDETAQEAPQSERKTTSQGFIMPEAGEQEKRHGTYLQTAIMERLNTEGSENEAKTGYISEFGSMFFALIRSLPMRAQTPAYFAAFAGTGVLLFMPEIKSIYKKINGLQEAKDDGNNA